MRRGAGRALLQAAVTRLREMGYRDAVLWMLTGNRAAHHFYSRNGWTPDDTGRRAAVWGVEVDEVRYRYAIVRRERGTAAP